MARQGGERLSLLATIAKWTGEADKLRRLGAQVDGASLIQAILGDLQAAADTEAKEPLTLEEAAAESGYSAEHLGRLLRDGTIPNAGRRNAPRILRGHLPFKPSALRETRLKPQLAGATPGQIARAVVNSSGGPR